MKKFLSILFTFVFLMSFVFAEQGANEDLWSDIQNDVDSSSPLDDASPATESPVENEESSYDFSEALNDENNFEESTNTEYSEDDFQNEWDEENPDYLVEVESASSSNRIDMPHRIFEMGTKLQFGASNNMFNTNDFLVKNLVIDLNKIVDQIPDQGMIFNILFAGDFFSNLNLKNGLHIGLSSGVETNASVGLDKRILDFVASGNSLGETIYSNGAAYTDVFAHINMALGMNIFGSYHLEVEPSLFRPVAHVTTNKAEMKVKNAEDGLIYMEAEADADIYSFFNLSPVFEGEEVSVDGILENIKQGWGFDISTSLEKRFFENFVFQAYARIPIVPGRLNYKTNYKAYFMGKIDGLAALAQESLDNAIDSEDSDDSSEDDSNSKFSEMEKDFTSSYDTAEYNLHRPFRIGVQTTWEPFGSWFTLGVLFGMGVKSPFSQEAKAYVEYDLSCRIGLPVPVIGQLLFLRISSGYFSEAFKQQVLIGLNFRALEFNAGISAEGSSFDSSFKGSGVGGIIYLAFGL